MRITVTALPLCWVVGGPTEKQEVKIACKVGLGCSFLSQSLRNSYLKISSSRDKHFAIWRKAKVSHPTSMRSSSFFYGNRSTQMKQFTIWDIPYLYKQDIKRMNRVTQKFYMSIHLFWNIFGNLSSKYNYNSVIP